MREENISLASRDGRPTRELGQADAAVARLAATPPIGAGWERLGGKSRRRPWITTRPPPSPPHGAAWTPRIPSPSRRRPKPPPSLASRLRWASLVSRAAGRDL
ncbi:hypothetical protein B2J93_6004 [Marssonina coronariae]|uniref:Uncharacterized protein n=1 Tax=Diplocarpon coronariae TaxID=2795749 RepID=A0A218YXM5_9HELO|nr:hypothetical protein B2J93_6004 [Marssonina coronariae]